MRVKCFLTLNNLLPAAGSIAKRSKSSDLDCGRGDPGSNPGEGRFFSALFRDGELSVTRIDGYVANNK